MLCVCCVVFGIFGGVFEGGFWSFFVGLFFFLFFLFFIFITFIYFSPLLFHSHNSNQNFFSLHLFAFSHTHFLLLLFFRLYLRLLFFSFQYSILFTTFHTSSSLYQNLFIPSYLHNLEIWKLDDDDDDDGIFWPC